MTNFNPLAKIWDDNWLTELNYMDWKKNLIIVLLADKIVYILKAEPLELALNVAIKGHTNAFDKWPILRIELYDQCIAKTITVRDMILYLKEMFREESRSARQTAMKYLMST